MICFSCSWSFAHLKFSWYSSARLKDHTGTTQCQQGYKWDDTTSKAIPYRAEFTYLARIWTVSDPGEGPGRSGPPSYFYTKLRPEGPKKKFLETGPSLYLRIRMTASPRSGGLDPPLIEVPHERTTRCKNLAKNKNILSSGWLII